MNNKFLVIYSNAVHKFNKKNRKWKIIITLLHINILFYINITQVLADKGLFSKKTLTIFEICHII